MKHKQTNIAIVDDHDIFRKGTRLLLDASSSYKVIIEARNGKELIKILASGTKLPDICLLDIRMPEMNGYDTIIELKKHWVEIKTLVVSSFNHEFAIINSLRCGANGFLPKDANAEELFFAIESIKSTGYYFSNMSPIDYMKVNSMPDLNNNEKQFLINCCEDLTYKQISEKMGLSQRTVETYRDNLFEKLKVNSRTGLVMFAVKNGLA